MKFLRADPSNYEFMSTDQTCDGITIMLAKKGATYTYDDHHAGKGKHNHPNGYPSMWESWKKSNMTTITNKNLNGANLQKQPMAQGDGSLFKAPYKYSYVSGTLKHSVSCIRMKGVDIVYILPTDDDLHHVKVNVADYQSPQEKKVQIAGVFLDARNPDSNNIDSKGLHVCSSRNNSIWKSKDYKSKHGTHIYAKNFTHFIAYLKDPNQDWEMTFINNDIPVDVFIPSGYDQSNFGSAATTNVQPFAGYHNDYAGNINLIYVYNCLCKFTLYDNKNNKKTWKNNFDTSCPQMIKLTPYTELNWKNQQSGSQGSDAIKSIGGISVELNKSAYCDPSMNNAGKSICQDYLKSTDILNQMVKHCQKSSDDKDPYKNIYNVVDNLDCISFSNNPKYPRFKTGTGTGSPGFDAVISDMCNDSNLTTIYGKDSDQLKKIKDICGCFPIGFTTEFQQLKDELIKQNQDVPNTCNPQCENNQNSYKIQGYQQCTQNICAMAQNVTGSSINAKDLSQKCTQTSSTAHTTTGGSPPGDNPSGGSPPGDNPPGGNPPGGNPLGGNPPVPPSNPSDSNTTTIIIVVVVILLLCSMGSSALYVYRSRR